MRNVLGTLSHQPSAISHPTFLPFSLDIIVDVNIFHVLFFFKGFLWFHAYRYGNAIDKLLDLGIVFFYLFEQYKHGRLRFNKRFIVLAMLFMLWVIHLCLTGFIESVRQGYIPTRFFERNISGGYIICIQHMIYGPFSAVIMKILKTMYGIYLCYVVIELLADNKDYKILKMFTWGNMIAIPFIIFSLNGRALFMPTAGAFRLSPEIQPDVYIHPNMIAILYVFALFANLIAFQKEDSRVLKTCHVLFCVIAMSIILLSGSRSCTICVTIAFIFLFLTVWKKRLLSLVTVLLILSVTLSVMLSYLTSISAITENPIIKRMSIETAKRDKGSGRLDGWYNYYKFTSMKQLLLGVGPLATTSTILYGKFPIRGGYIHDHPSNTYIYMLLTYGVGGFLIFMLFILRMFLKLLANIRHDKDINDYIAMAMLLGICALKITGYYPPFFALKGTAIFWCYIFSRTIKQ